MTSGRTPSSPPTPTPSVPSVTSAWKLIVYPKVHETQLFDLRTDPGEMHDLAEDPNHTGERERLIKVLRDWQSRLDDPQPQVVSGSS